jgi:hypothetical protein
MQTSMDIFPREELCAHTIMHTIHYPILFTSTVRLVCVRCCPSVWLACEL